MLKNYGLRIEAEARVKDWIFGGISAIEPVNLVEKGWSDYLPVKEVQRNKFFDSMACVTFSALNCLEILHKRLYEIEVNWSDRWMARVSGTTTKGNYLSTVADTIRKKGLILEEFWQFDNFKSWNEYMADPPDELDDYGKEFLEHYEVRWEWVMTRNAKYLKGVLRIAPLQVTGFAWEKPIDGIYKRTTKKANHAFTVHDYKDGEYWLAFDHYDRSIKKLAWNFKFGHIIKYKLEQKKPMPAQIPNNTLVQLVEGKGGFALALDGKLIVDKLDKVLASFIVRNEGEIDGKTKALLQEDWDSFSKINLKKQPI
jgi:hypothetical protein